MFKNGLAVIFMAVLLSSCVTTSYEGVSGTENVRKVMIEGKTPSYQIKTIGSGAGWYDAVNKDGTWSLSNEGAVARAVAISKTGASGGAVGGC